MNPLVTSALGSVLRFLLAGAAGYLVRKGIWSGGEADAYLGAAVTGLLALGLSLWNKYHGRLKLLTALATPYATTETHVNALIKDGQAPASTTARDDVPVLTKPTE